MAANRVPDEILLEILRPALHVPDSMFADTGRVSPFRLATCSSADILCVCKSWCRVATLFLYKTVITRSMAQARALTVTLQHEATLDRHIRRLRIEGAYGEHLNVLCRFAASITHFCFTLSIYPDTPTDGLLRLLDTIQHPTTTILTIARQDVVENKAQVDVAIKCSFRIAAWSSLVRVS